MRISDWSSDVCSSDLLAQACVGGGQRGAVAQGFADQGVELGVAERGPPVAGRERGVAERRNIQAAAAGERIGFDRVFPRSEERREGKECASSCRSRGAPYLYKKNTNTQTINQT